MYILGFDIGGTKCAVITATWENEQITILKKEKCDTDHTVSGEVMLRRLMEMADKLLERKPDRIGISCGGPLDARAGVILSPPNLPTWKQVPVVQLVREHYGAQTQLQNDANACAVAEWKFGAGRGCQNMVFLTFGTGMGAGLILGGRLYEGTNGNAGELGHIRLAEDGPEGYGKNGSFEGFCSGGGIARLAQQGEKPSCVREGQAVTAKTVAQAARQGDATALEVYHTSGAYLGRGLALVLDLLNPELVVIGSIFARDEGLLRAAMEAQLVKEALPQAVQCCRIVPAVLGEEIGDYAAIATALL